MNAHHDYIMYNQNINEERYMANMSFQYYCLQRMDDEVSSGTILAYLLLVLMEYQIPKSAIILKIQAKGGGSFFSTITFRNFT